VVSPAYPITAAPPGSIGIDALLAAARARLHRLDPHDAYVATERGAVLIDIRPAAQRAEYGEIPTALIIERNVLEWRLDPRSDARLGFATRYDLQVIVLCQEGYTSSLAAAALHDLGLTRATDVVGGFAAWQAAGLPTR
jgi:rhodanese-related sulfurtransferase